MTLLIRPETPADYAAINDVTESAFRQAEHSNFTEHLILPAWAQAVLRQLGAAGCGVLGGPHYYQHFGFRPRAELWLADVPAKYFLTQAFGEHRTGGEVRYHPAFSATTPAC